MSRYFCPMCVRRGKVWQGDDPRCAFVDGVFTTDNWNCATMNAIRDALCEGDDFYAGPTSCGGRVRLLRDEDTTMATMGGSLLDGDPAEHGEFIVVSWYKRRGRTAGAYTVDDDGKQYPFTLSQASSLLRALAARDKERGR